MGSIDANGEAKARQAWMFGKAVRERVLAGRQWDRRVGCLGQTGQAKEGECKEFHRVRNPALSAATKSVGLVMCVDTRDA